ncbi:hypothetical protein [Candidatus Xianfuyuplasma coldseepsis]|uniref:Lipoprotein n=1 Tax=Candidatus Xianfuyuplasma coldseepsis TaxID=2782163 RepID=A0A7L7KSH0_9MOLU|nr:hypothetical protein [Xianfuyuplasma coldseepsis]QMS84894.1 hypothetical protein G4Z02_03705 [Xianfuyuplasma coldseepsis]
MKRLFLILSLSILLTGCGLFDRGNYEKNRSGYVISENLIIQYHTNSIGEIDIFLIDQLMTYFEALDYTQFDVDQLESDAEFSNIVTSEELLSCGITRETAIPRFIRIADETYVYNVRDNGYCSYDEYIFHNGFSEPEVPEQDIPIEITNIQRFKQADFKLNTFEDILFIEQITFNSFRWEKEIVSVLPMSYTQAGNTYERLSETMSEIHVLENYILQNQSINLLTLRDDYQDEDVNNIWSEETIEALGRDHELIKQVRLKNAGDILDAIYDTLSRLGMFQ